MSEIRPDVQAADSTGVGRRRSSTRPLLVFSLVLAAACQNPAEEPTTSPGHDSLERVAVSTQGMVVSSSRPATRAGAEILASGGNAVDAAVAAAFGLAVAEPTQSGLGGRTQALVWHPTGEAAGVDATTEVPAGYDPSQAEPAEDGYSVIAIPGTVAGLARVHREGGRLPWPEVIGPALRLAESGFPLSPGEAARINGIRERLADSEGARVAFLKPDGSEWAPGDILVQPWLAEVLRALSREGPSVFYEGWVADSMTADFARNGAAVVASDLALYEAEPALVVRGEFGELELVGTYLPASGATTIEALQIVDRVELPAPASGERYLVLGEALLAAFQDRETARADPRPPAADASWITSDSLADRRAAAIGVASGGRARGQGPATDVESPNTSHISVVDGEGMAVAMTQSLGPTGGARVATPGLGFLYAATMGYLDRPEPGARPWSSQSPLVGVRDGRLALVMGGAGARRIISAMVGTLVRMEVDGAHVEEAMAAPRFHPSGSWTFEEVDPSRAPVGAAAARASGRQVELRPSDTFFARLNVIVADPETGRLTGVADPRWAWGGAAGPDWWSDRLGQPSEVR
jgi:gamma-glutamyltranspeptidase/glutathione hydrolase